MPGHINCKIAEAQLCPTQKYWKIWQNVEFCEILACIFCSIQRGRQTHTHTQTQLTHRYTHYV